MFFQTGHTAPITCLSSKALARRVYIFAVIISLLPVELISTAQASGNCIFDSTFGQDGLVTTSFSDNSLDVASFVVLQPNGKIVEGGFTTASVNGVSDFALVRYHNNGSLDDSFGQGGKVHTHFGGLDSRMTALAVQRDEKIVATGYNSYGISHAFDFVLARYNSNGSLDRGFGHSGRVIISRSEFFPSNALALQPDGKIVVGGSITRDPVFLPDFILLRYNADGSPDDGTSKDSTPGDSFGDHGRVTTRFDGFQAILTSLALQRDGKIVAAGYNTYAGYTRQEFALARYNYDGSLDTTFDGDGILTTSFGAAGIANDVVIQPDGKIVAAGSRLAYRGGQIYQSDFAIARYNPDGQLDTSFDHDGKVFTIIPGSPRFAGINALALARDGKIVVAGGSYGYSLAMARYNGDGSLDTTFGTSGKLLFGGFTGPISRDLAIQANGKIVVAGMDNYAFALLRLPGGVTNGIDSLTLSNSTAPACHAVQGTVHLCAPAPPGGLTVALASTNPAAIVPSSITIPEGQNEASFDVRTGSAAGVTSGYIIAGAGRLTEKAPLTVRPVGVLSLTLSPNPVPGSHGVTGLVTLECHAPAGGVAVTLSSSDEEVAYPTMSQINIAPGSSRRSFTIRTSNVASARQAIIKATANRISKSQVLTIQ